MAGDHRCGRGRLGRLPLAVEESYGTEDIVGAEDLVEDLRDPYVDPERGTIAAFSEGSVIAYAGLRASPGGMSETRRSATTRGSAPTTAESWKHFIGHQRLRPAASFLAYLGDKLAGVLIAHEYDAFRQVTGRRECYIATVGVTKAARGIASALIRRCLAAAQADGCNIATLWVHTGSPTGALTLYEHMGFTRQRTSVTLIKDLTDQ